MQICVWPYIVYHTYHYSTPIAFHLLFYLPAVLPNTCLMFHALLVSLHILLWQLPLGCCRGWQGLIAQGCHSSILIIDPKTAQTIQVLERHKTNVVKVSFLTK